MAMPIHNADIARIFEEMADLLEIGAANPFRVRAYRNAARLVGDLQLDIAATLAKGATLPKLPGIGEKTETKLLQAAEGHLGASRRFKLAVAAQYAEALIAYLRQAPGAVEFTVYPLLALALRMQQKKKSDLAISEAIGPQLAAWMARVEALSYFDRTYPPHWRA